MSRAEREFDSFRWRAHVVLVLLVLMFLVLLGRILSLQVMDMGRGVHFLQHQGDLRTVRSTELPAYRGVITDRHGEPLAVSTPVSTLVGNPTRLASSERLAELAHALNMPLGELQARVRQYAGKQFMYLERRMVPSVARAVLALDIEGVRELREYQRYYPAGEVAAQLVGMTNVDGHGVAGIELAYDSWLSGRSGRKQYIKDRLGEAVRYIGEVEPAQPGRALQLSIDLRLQTLQHRELERAVLATGAIAGSVVTLDAHSGEVLACASYPDFNPNNRSDVNMDGTRSRAFTDVVEPGSTVKPLTLVAALESGRYRTDSIIDTSPGRIRVGRKVLPDPRDYGAISLATVIEKSSQVGVTKIAQDIGHEPVLDVFRRFGLGVAPATGFPGERSGMLPQRARWSDIEKVTVAFGYGLTATPLQLARAYAVFAGDGLLPQVSLLRRQAPVPGERVIPAALAREVRAVLDASFPLL
jgi:cell division protein FtsI (penicillin-binding protein 3)